MVTIRQSLASSPMDSASPFERARSLLGRKKRPFRPISQIAFPFLIALSLSLAVDLIAYPRSAYAVSEKEVQAVICEGMRQGVRTESGTYADCVSDIHAIEIDWTGNWKEALGQALHYGSALDKKSGIYLVCREDTEQSLCLKHKLGLEETIANQGLNVDVWFFNEDEI